MINLIESSKDDWYDSVTESKPEIKKCSVLVYDNIDASERRSISFDKEDEMELADHFETYNFNSVDELVDSLKYDFSGLWLDDDAELEDCIEAVEDQDWGSGDPIICKITIGKDVIYDEYDSLIDCL